MSRQPRSNPDLPTLWEVSDDLWDRILPLLRQDWRPSPKGGQPPADWRKIFNGILFRLRSGCQWNHLPKEFGDDSTVHRWFQRWCKHGVMQAVWADLVEECEELGEVYWDWQSADGSMGKARFGGEKGGQQSHGPEQAGHEEKPVGR